MPPFYFLPLAPPLPALTLWSDCPVEMSRGHAGSVMNIYTHAERSEVKLNGWVSWPFDKHFSFIYKLPEPLLTIHECMCFLAPFVRETFQSILEIDFMCFRNITIPGFLQDRHWLNLVPMHSLNGKQLILNIHMCVWWCSCAHDWSNALLGLAWTQFKPKEIVEMVGSNCRAASQ